MIYLSFSMEQALKNTIIAGKYQLTLKSFFKDEFKYWNDSYLIPFSHILYTRKQIFDYILASCGDVCSKLVRCHGHQFVNYIELIYQFNRYSVIKKKVYFEYFLFTKFEVSSNKMTLKPTKIKRWKMIPVHKQVLNDLTYSQRLTFLK